MIRLILFVVAVVAQEDPCLTKNQLTDIWRSLAYTNASNNCDSLMWEGWYIVTSKAGSDMPTTCPTGGFRCGTTYPLYLSPAHNPTPLLPGPGKTVNRTVCSAHFTGDCCRNQVTIKIKNCGEFYVYFLRRPSSCPSAYCFGNNLPCPPGENSENGFSPGCDKYPNITVQSTQVTAGLYKENRMNNNEMYTYETIQFQCHTNIDTRYRYDVRWYIDDFEITKAAFVNMSHTALVTETMLHQHHWEQKFKPNMMVQCSIQIRDANFPAPGPRKYSTKFFAGVQIKQDANARVLVEGDPPVGIEVSLTIPIGCMYPINNAILSEQIKSLCLLNLLTAVPLYQVDNSHCKNGLSDESLALQSQMCGVVFKFNETTKHIVNVSGAVDKKINFNDRISVLQLYQDITTNTEIDELNIWLGLTLPQIMFTVQDKDRITAGRKCYSNNDPHMISFDGKKYELQRSVGEYIMYQHAQLPIIIHSYYQRCHSALCNCGAAVRSGNSLFVANFCERNNYVIQNICDESDIDVQKQGNGYVVTVPSGTRLIIRMGVYWGAYIITTYQIQSSSLDFGMTSGLCGIFNLKTGDDFTMRNGQLTSSNNNFAESWRIKKMKESLFNAKNLQPVKSKAKEHCTCKKAAGSFPYGKPEIICNVTAAMTPCREQNLPSSVFAGRCKSVTHERRKREASVITDEEPEQYPLELNDSNPAVPDLTWKNGWTEQKAKDHCNQAFDSMTTLELCSTYVPSIPADSFISECVFDIQITGDTEWVEESQNNFAVSCMVEASRMENLTKSNSTGNESEEQSIFEQIASVSCPKNCSGHGVCREGECNCTSEFFGEDCSMPVTAAPIISTFKFNSKCDTTQRPCRKYIVPGIHFREGNLTCRFRSYKIYYNETVEDGIVEEVEGKYVGPFAIHCVAPETRLRRSIQNDITPRGYYLSISNDGLNYTDEVPLVIYNSLCFNCNMTTIICQELDSCPEKQVPVVIVTTANDNTAYLIIGICCGLLLAISVVIVSIAIRFKKKQRISDSTLGLKTDFFRRRKASEN